MWRGELAATILNCNLSTLLFIYLGLPIKVMSLTREDWQSLIERVEKKLATWKGNTLSKGGRLILVNLVFSNLPLYFLSFYYLPEWVIYVIDCIRHAFFFGKVKKYTFYLINWQLVCSHKNQCGLGVCNLWAFNLAILSKWWWRHFHDTHASRMALVFHNYYRRRKHHDLHNTLPGMFLPFGEEF